MRFFTSQRGKYAWISHNDGSKENQGDEFAPEPTSSSDWKQIIRYTALIAVAATLGYLAGGYRPDLDIRRELEIRSTLRTFDYNLTFANAPSSKTDAAWASIMPSNGGFVKNPTGGPEVTGLSLFHQLHCLDILRRLYYEAALNLAPDDSIEDPPAHARHCFDFLRQSLMCAGDLTIESEIKAGGGITGIGTTHRCVDYDRIIAWAESQGLPPP